MKYNQLVCPTQLLLLSKLWDVYHYHILSLKELSKGKEAEKVSENLSDYLLQAKWLINRIHSIHRIEIPKKELLEKIFSGEVEELLQLFQKVAPQCISEKKIQKESILNINRNFDSKLILERSKSLDFETQQMISSLHTWIESTSRTQITRKEFIQNITWSDLYSVHRRNVEDLLELVLLLVPTWIWEEVKNNKVIYRIDRDITLESVSWIEKAQLKLAMEQLGAPVLIRNRAECLQVLRNSLHM